MVANLIQIIDQRIGTTHAFTSKSLWIFPSLNLWTVRRVCSFRWGKERPLVSEEKRSEGERSGGGGRRKDYTFKGEENQHTSPIGGELIGFGKVRHIRAGSKFACDRASVWRVCVSRQLRSTMPVNARCRTLPAT